MKNKIRDIYDVIKLQCIAFMSLFVIITGSLALKIPTNAVSFSYVVLFTSLIFVVGIFPPLSISIFLFYRTFYQKSFFKTFLYFTLKNWMVFFIYFWLFYIIFCWFYPGSVYFMLHPVASDTLNRASMINPWVNILNIVKYIIVMGAILAIIISSIVTIFLALSQMVVYLFIYRKR